MFPMDAKPRLDIDGLLLDIDGVLTISWRPIEGAREALDFLRHKDIPFRLLTNTTELSRKQVLNRLNDAGLDVSVDDVVTAAVVTAAYVRSNHPSARCYVIGAEPSREDLEGIEVVEEKGDVLIIGGVAGPIDWDVMNRALRMVLDGAPFILMHRSITWMTDEGLVIDSGVVLSAGLEEATDTAPIVCGKPSPECFRQTLQGMRLEAERAAMIGDDIKSDVMAAKAVGMTGVLVKTGKFHAASVERAGGTPDHIIDSIANLPTLLKGA